MDIMVSIREAIQAFRKKAGWNEEELARRISVPTEWIYEFEEGKRVPNLYNLDLMAKTFKQQVKDFFDQKEIEYAKQYVTVKKVNVEVTEVAIGIGCEGVGIDVFERLPNGENGIKIRDLCTEDLLPFSKSDDYIKRNIESKYEIATIEYFEVF